MVASVKGEYPQFPLRGNGYYHLKEQSHHGMTYLQRWLILGSEWLQQMTLIDVEKVMAPSVKQ